LAVHQDIARQQDGLRSFARWSKTAFSDQEVQPSFSYLAHGAGMFENCVTRVLQFHR
jgi:hypothetical protein